VSTDGVRWVTLWFVATNDTVLLVGTRKGLWIGRSADRVDWSWTGPHFDMTEVYAVMVDKRGGATRLFAAPSSSWTGPQLWFSDDLGRSWQETKGVRYPDDVDASVERIWQLAGGPDPDTVWAGTEPGAVFRSTDGGQSFELERALWDHPHRPQWNAGFGGQAFHTLLPHPTDPDSLTAALSTGGVYQTTDGGRSWEPRNQGIRAEFLPEGQQYPEFGQCVHKVTRHASRPERMYLQNHGGVYRSDDEGGHWDYIGDGLPVDFGFPIVVHPQDPETIFVFPLQGGDRRYPVDAKARVWRSTDAGGTWAPLEDGLPDDFFVGVMRDGMSADDHEQPGLYFGARNGSVWASADTGESWSCANANLPDVLVVRAASL
jgi:hypothetical protein